MTKSLFRVLLGLTAAVFLGATALPAAAATLTYNDPNCAGFQITGSGGSFTPTCAKLQCSISGTTNPTTQQNTSLTATCTPAGGSYLWSLVTGPFSDAACRPCRRRRWPPPRSTGPQASWRARPNRAYVR
jgi:hypothetical protein